MGFAIAELGHANNIVVIKTRPFRNQVTGGTKLSSYLVDLILIS